MNAVAVKNCPNCTGPLTSQDHFCPHCGQTAHLHRFNLPHVFHEFFHAITHADKGLLHLLGGLITQPGVVAREYVLEGKRKKYFNPFTFLALSVGLVLFINSIFFPYTRSLPTTDSVATQPYSTEQQRQKAMGFAERRHKMLTFIEKRGNIVIFLAVPLLALVYWLFFLRTGINYAEHLVAHVFFTGFYVLMMSFVLTPLGQFLPDGPLYKMLPLLVHMIYLTIAYYQFLPRPTSYKLLKTGFAALGAMIVWMVVSYGAGALYIAFG